MSLSEQDEEEAERGVRGMDEADGRGDRSEARRAGADRSACFASWWRIGPVLNVTLSSPMEDVIKGQSHSHFLHLHCKVRS